ncbi:MAG: hypothetical protein MMC33_010181 [Icmadophila ericetorum]|nr:hypothetical protein [Icmadophila ericetorum]
MENSPHSSIYVAPLQITKGKSRGKSVTRNSLRVSTSNGSKRDYKRESLSKTQKRASDSNASKEKQANAQNRQSDSQPVLFHSYLRAFYPYHPDCNESSTTVTLPLNQGDVILVHSVHTNGWADGTTLVSGHRGWLPTNYCQPYEEQPIFNLLKAVTDFWDMVQTCGNGNPGAFKSQDYSRGLVAGVRYLLESTNCLNRESTIVQSNNGLRRNRKALLSDLSTLVKNLRELQIKLEADPDFQLNDEHLDIVLSKAYKMTTRAVKFLDVWIEEIEPEDNIDASIAALDWIVEASAAVPLNSVASETLDGAIKNRSRGDSTVTTRPISVANAVVTRDNNYQGSTRSRQSRSSQTFTGAESLHPDVNNKRPVSMTTRLNSASHRISVSTPLSKSRALPLASEKLSAAHESFQNILSSFMGPHLQNRSSIDLLQASQQVINSWRDMLAVVEAVEAARKGDLRCSENLDQVCDDIYDRLTGLLQAARDILQPSRTEDRDVFPLEDRKRLVDCAVACVQGAGECVAKTRFVLERIGDFEFEVVGLGILSQEEDSTGLSKVLSKDSQPPERSDPVKELSYPPEPLNRPPPPPSRISHHSTSTTSEVAPETDNIRGSSQSSTPTSERSSVHSLLPPLPHLTSPLMQFEDYTTSAQNSFSSNNDPTHESTKAGRIESIGVSSMGSSSTYIGSFSDSIKEVASPTSTRATSPDLSSPQTPGLSISFSFTGSQSTLDDECEATEAKVLEKTYAHELMYNKDGQIMGGSLPALIERLTTYDSTPDALFVSTFYLTFRLFATPISFARALIDRFEYVNNSPHIAGPVRLRVCNVFKGWLESHWRNDLDKVALPLILPFAANQLSLALPSAGKRLTELIQKASSSSNPLVPRLISSIGKTNTSVAKYVAPNTPLPAPIITKSQLTALRNWKQSGSGVSILEFDPLELARQFTIKESRIFCSILPEELLATEWMKKSGSMAVNVRAMSTISTDLANLVADCILQMEDTAKRAKLIKHWVKIANRCYELSNYDSLMAIICSLTSATITRLKRTWEIVSTKTKTTLEELKKVVEVSKNYAVLRQTLQGQSPPCLPFVGIYLTDLTFIDLGNQPFRQLPGRAADDESSSVINFDKHMKTAKVISELQRFQIPYRLTEVPELQTWMQDQLVRVRSSDQGAFQSQFRRSLMLEPREQNTINKSPVEFQLSKFSSKEGVKEKFDLFSLTWPHPAKERTNSKSHVMT